MTALNRLGHQVQQLSSDISKFLEHASNAAAATDETKLVFELFRDSWAATDDVNLTFSFSLESLPVKIENFLFIKRKFKQANM